MNEERYTQAVCNLHGEKMTQHFSCHLCERERVAALVEMRRKAEALDWLEKMAHATEGITIKEAELDPCIGQILVYGHGFGRVAPDLLTAIESAIRTTFSQQIGR